MNSSNSLNKPSSFNGYGYILWKEKMKFFIEGVDHSIWNTMKEGPFVLTHKVNGVVEKKIIGPKVINKMYNIV